MARSLRRVWQGLPWQSSGLDSTLALQGAQAPSLVRELRSHMLCSTAPPAPEKKYMTFCLRHLWVMAWGSSLSIFMPLVSDRAEYSNAEETGQLHLAGSRPPHRHSQSCWEHCWVCRHTWYIRQGPGRKQMACSKRIMWESWMKGLFTEVWAALRVWKQWSWYQPSTINSTRPEGTGTEQAAWRAVGFCLRGTDSSQWPHKEGVKGKTLWAELCPSP